MSEAKHSSGHKNFAGRRSLENLYGLANCIHHLPTAYPPNLPALQVYSLVLSRPSMVNVHLDHFDVSVHAYPCYVGNELFKTGPRPLEIQLLTILSAHFFQRMRPLTKRRSLSQLEHQKVICEMGTFRRKNEQRLTGAQCYKELGELVISIAPSRLKLASNKRMLKQISSLYNHF